MSLKHLVSNCFIINAADASLYVCCFQQSGATTFQFAATQAPANQSPQGGW